VPTRYCRGITLRRIAIIATGSSVLLKASFNLRMLALPTRSSGMIPASFPPDVSSEELHRRLYRRVDERDLPADFLP